MLCVEELLELEESLKSELNDNLTSILTKLNRSNQLNTLLQLLGMEHLLNAVPGYQVYKTGKIIVIGQSNAKKNDLLAVAHKLGLEKNRFDFYLEYDDAKTFNFKKIQWNSTYTAVLVGPMGHSGAGKGNYISVISAIESEEGYPPVIRLGSNELKITKTNFKNKLMELMDSGKIA